ncbi:precorrin-2 dehydrogenase/sirohydrochlorin ferrochelatase family protein [Geomobilimonas luticola]|uniref:precorrin-2 dehydrogenase n=1 Tax=Geomobilimonas luticola TaxID=1114878 RepID=A0ABS5SH95_9BACT|nr:bifunctional precorrin-2 dehydrogenase/sirohydrochlorin ferrochelatase [Geomobilimonas luticola]MBT0653412.1 bifunctional precorrin-2 dehydrogenase/sirohydrochlorin ferrochelatase [Geomobilimonas luticola]
MQHYPVNLVLAGRRTVIIGGGAVAARKCESLLATGSRITVVAPCLDPALEKLCRENRIVHESRPYRYGDLDGAFLVFAATGDAAVNRAVAEEAAARGILADIVDAPECSTFVTPATVRRGDLLITISTGGKSPALSARLRAELAERYGGEYGTALELLGAIREKLLTEKGNTAYNKELFNALLDRDLPLLLKSWSPSVLDHILTDIFGPGFTLEELGIRERETS